MTQEQSSGHKLHRGDWVRCIDARGCCTIRYGNIYTIDFVTSDIQNVSLVDSNATRDIRYNMKRFKKLSQLEVDTLQNYAKKHLKEDKKDTVIKVVFPKGSTHYSYLCKDLDVKVGDHVIVPNNGYHIGFEFQIAKVVTVNALSNASIYILEVFKPNTSYVLKKLKTQYNRHAACLEEIEQQRIYLNHEMNTLKVKMTNL